MATDDDYSGDSDSDFQRVLDIFNESSDEEFSGFESDEIEDSDDDVTSDNWQQQERNDGKNETENDDLNVQNGEATIPRCELTPGPKLPRDFKVETSRPLDYFNLFLPETIYDHIAKETNSYAALCQREKNMADKHWTETTHMEIKAYLGLNILMGVSPRHNYEDYWKDDDYLGSQGFKTTMTLNRYEKLTQYFHVNSAAARHQRNDDNFHPINKVKPIYDMAKLNFKKYYQHGTEVSIDEAMKGYKGRCEIRQYMPAKPEKFGLKFWARCDGNTSYMSDFSLYTGKRDRNNIQTQYGLGYRVVHDMTRDLVGLNHHVYHDRFFTGVQLANDLFGDGIYTCGTVNVNRKDLPLPLKQKKSVIKRTIPNRGDYVTYEKDSMSVTAWNDNNVVIILYNNSDDDPVRCERQIGRNREKFFQPKALFNYNKYMNGVDIHDQLRKKYAAGRASKKYWKYIMWFVIDCCRVNSYLVYKEVSTRVLRKKRYTHMDFVCELGRSLVGNFCSRKRLCIREVMTPLTFGENQAPHCHVRMEGKRRRCKVCYTKNIRKETVKGCAVCNIHLCDDCFLEKHS